ncbi:unnamed protein product [Protopolystoma xenopodis]|uniref:Uncharacterized protein n=1 Tax=Protopolystoma xenopodis TaxID=117903 RepID=A0A3S5FF83_9PLAT|nr:unnamed protein product [Protopolystoma xenopodis]
MSDPDSPLSLISCSGCGARLHSRSPGKAGFIPLKELLSISKQTQSTSSPTLIQVSADPESYKGVVLHHIRKQCDAVIIVVADMLNLPHCLDQALFSDIGSHRYFIFVF